MQWPVLQMLFFSVRSHSIAMPWSPPSHRAKTELLWNLESVPAVFAKLSWNFHPSLSGCSALAGNGQYVTSLSIYYWNMTYSDGLYLKKLHSACSILGQNTYISCEPNGALLGVQWWSSLLTAYLMSSYLVNERNQSEAPELSRFLNYQDLYLHALSFAQPVSL